MEDLTGRKFNRLLVLGFHHTNKYRVSYWLCKCDCGKETVARRSNLLNEETKSCGCLNNEKRMLRFFKHGMSKTIEYSSWQHMKDRCLNPRFQDYHNYGGRGITICPEWVDSFEQFYEDMKSCPDGCSLDRIDNEKGYFPENCKWSTRKEQTRNMRRNIFITLNDKTMCLKDWCAELCLPYTQILQRIVTLKWDEQTALLTPIKRGNKYATLRRSV